MSVKMYVGELKKALEEWPDDCEVGIITEVDSYQIDHITSYNKDLALEIQADESHYGKIVCFINAAKRH